MELSEERIQELKEIMQKDSREEITDEKAREAAHNFAGYLDIVWEVAKRHVQNEKRLKAEPDGFPVEGTYNCLVCYTSINPQTGWYHKGGQRCLNCHRAIKNGVIPAYVIKHSDSFFRMWKVADMFKVRTVSVRKMIREGKLVAREITNEEGKILDYIFLKKDNPGLIERHNPEWKSYIRHRDKMTEKSKREFREEMRKDMAKLRKRSRLK